MIRRHPTLRTLMVFYDGELDDAEARVVEAHASECTRCGSWLADLESVGAVVRGDVVPAATPSRSARRARARSLATRRPVLERIVPALAAVAAVSTVMVLVVTNSPGDDDDLAFTETGALEHVPLPSIPSGAATGDPAAVPAPGSEGRGPTSTRPGGDSPTLTGASPGVAPAPGAGQEPDPLVVAVMVPGGTAGPGAPVVHAVATALAEANAAGGIHGRQLELVAADAGDPGVPAALAERKVAAVIGGYGAPPSTWASLAARKLPWFGPADAGATNAGHVVAVEISHQAAGRLLADALAGRKRQRVAAIVGGAVEKQLADGLAGGMPTTLVSTTDNESCTRALERATAGGADVLALALAPVGVTRCLGALPAQYPIREIVVPSSAVDEAMAAVPSGFGVTAALGAPGPGDTGAGAERFRAATGVRGNYRATVSYAAAELAVWALRRSPSDPMAGFAGGGVYRSDLVTMNPSATPLNVAVQVVDLKAGGGSSPPATPSPGFDAGG